MKNLLIIYLLLTGVIAEAQTSQGFGEMSCGRSFPDGKDISARQIKLPGAVYQTDVINDSLLAAVLREKDRRGNYINNGLLCAINIRTGKMEWSKKIQYFNIYFTKDFILYGNEDGMKVFEKRSGKFLYTDEGQYEYIDEDRNFVLKAGGYHFDLATRKTNWHRSIPSKFGYWVEVKWISDSSFYIASDGIHYLDLKDGKGWSYKMRPPVASNRLPHQYIKQFVSNMLFNKLNKDIVYVGYDEVVRIDSFGNEIWRTRNLKKEIGISTLLKYDNTLVDFNLGLDVPFGAGASLSGYDVASGRELYHKKLKGDHMVRSYAVIDDTVYIHIKGYYHKYRLSTGALLATKEDQSMISLEHIDPEITFEKGEDSCRLISLETTYPKQPFIKNYYGDIILLDGALGQKKTWSKESVWEYWSVYKDVHIFQNNRELLFRSRTDCIAQINLSGELTLKDDDLIITRDNMLSVVRLTDFLN